MSRISNIFRAITGAARSYRAYLLGSPEVYAAITAEKAIENGFNKNTAVYSIVMKDAEKFASIPRYVYDKAKYEEKTGKPFKYEVKAMAKKPYLENDLSVLLNRPNPDESADEFFTKVRACYKVCGEAFIWLNRGDNMFVDSNGELMEMDEETRSKQPVLEMHALPPNHVIVLPDKENMFGKSGYQLDFASRPFLNKIDVIHWKSTNLKFDAVDRQQLRGHPPLESGYKTLQQNNDATDGAVRMYQNDGAKGVLFNKTVGKMTPEQSSTLSSVVNKKINNNDIKGAVATLQGEWGYLNLQGTSVDMELLKGKEFSWKELCFLFKVPYEFFDSETTFANKEQALIGWITNDILPALKRLDGELNRVLLKAFGLEKKAFIASDITELPEMRKSMVESAKLMLDNWAITPNEIREYLGYERSTEPTFDEQWVPSGRTPLSMTGESEADAIMNELEAERMKVETDLIKKDVKR